MTQYCLVYITTKDEEEAEKIGKALVSERLAACANLHPIKSIFRWQGQISQEDEVALLAKTKAELANEVISRVKELHSYEVPCVIVLPIEKGNPDFLAWLSQSTK
ncbi:divalent-cation tolerance protein CutA [Chloroflexota bacterium]